MTSQATFFHAGCPVCVSAEQTLASALDPSRYALERVHLGEDHGRIAEARSLGVASVPALVLDGQVLHINHGASLDDLTAEG
jgi:glutaredoxin